MNRNLVAALDGLLAQGYDSNRKAVLLDLMQHKAAVDASLQKLGELVQRARGLPAQLRDLDAQLDREKRVLEQMNAAAPLLLDKDAESQLRRDAEAEERRARTLEDELSRLRRRPRRQ